MNQLVRPCTGRLLIGGIAAKRVKDRDWWRKNKDPNDLIFDPEDLAIGEEKDLLQSFFLPALSAELPFLVLDLPMNRGDLHSIQLQDSCRVLYLEEGELWSNALVVSRIPFTDFIMGNGSIRPWSEEWFTNKVRADSVTRKTKIMRDIAPELLKMVRLEALRERLQEI